MNEQERRDFRAFQRERANLTNFIQKVKKLNIKTEDWDAVSFFRSGNNRSYIFNMVTFEPKNGVACDFEMSENGLGHKYIIVCNDYTGLYKDENVVLGDPMWILLHNYIIGGQQGFIFKQCAEGRAMANEIYDDAMKTLKTLQDLIASNVAVRRV